MADTNRKKTVDQAGSSGTAAGPPGTRIVIVEDSDDTRTMLAALLALEGYEVQTAGDGVAGMELIVASKPDVALLDIELPGIDGYQVARRVQEQLGEHEIRLIALTGREGDEERQAARDAGFDDWLAKPFPVPALMAVLRRQAGSDASSSSSAQAT